ncbi:MAG: nitroreductase family protein [Candidatus Hydrogenedens sp.]|nr:nitroreductase family protein [Candidatus Hydrogenedens sp.]
MNPSTLENHAQVFHEIADSRRSVRKFLDEAIPEDVVRACLEEALLAPNSSNLQTWYFRWVRSAGPRKELARACMGQNAAKTASDLIVITVRPHVWRQHCDWNLAHYPVDPAPKIVGTYYRKLAKMLYAIGPFGVLSPVKRLAFALIGLRQPMIRGLYSVADRRVWAVKSAALASENLMLAFSAHGYDTCPMEGFDKVLVHRQLNIPHSEEIVMIVAAGRRAPEGVYHESYRIPLDELLEKF